MKSSLLKLGFRMKVQSKNLIRDNILDTDHIREHTDNMVMKPFC